METLGGGVAARSSVIAIFIGPASSRLVHYGVWKALDLIPS